MRKALGAGALALTAALFLPVSPAAAHDQIGHEGYLCDGTDESSYTPAGAKLDRFDKNLNQYICVHAILKRNGDYRLTYYDDYPDPTAP